MLQKPERWRPRPGDPVPEGLFVERAEDLRRTSGDTPVRSVDDGALALTFGEGGLSRASFRVQPGADWIASCSVTLMASGQLLPCKFGPVFLDGEGKIAKWWSTIRPAFDHNDSCRLNIKSTAPAGAVWVKLGLLGPWEQNAHTTAVYRFSDCLLVRSDPEAGR